MMWNTIIKNTFLIQGKLEEIYQTLKEHPYQENLGLMGGSAGIALFQLEKSANFNS